MALGNGNGTFQAVKLGIADFGVNQGWTTDEFFHRTLADVNGDGLADIVGFGQSDGVWVSVSNGDGTFGVAQFAPANIIGSIGGFSIDEFNRLVVDVNGDRFADLVGFGDGETYIAFGRGDGTFTPASRDIADFGRAKGWVRDNTFHREVADVNHDGLADIVGFGIAGVLVGTNQGDFLI